MKNLEINPSSKRTAMSHVNPVFNTIRTPLMYRWARTVRSRIHDGRHKVIFDVETDPRYRANTVEFKVDIVNNTFAKFGEDAWDCVDAEEYRKVIEGFYKDRTVLSAMLYMYMGLTADLNLFDDLVDMREKALASADPTKLMNFHTFIDKKLKTMTESRLLKEWYNEYHRKKEMKKQEKAGAIDITDPLDAAKSKKMAKNRQVK